MKRYLAALLALCMMMLAGCAKENTPSPVAPGVSTPMEPSTPPPEPEPEPQERMIAANGLEIPIPAEYDKLLVLDTQLEAWNEHWTPLISISEKASLEDYNRDNPNEDAGAGWLCSILRLDRIGFEAWISEDDATSGRIFAKDSEGRYYLLSRPTDVTFYRSDTGVDADEKRLEQWENLNAWADGLSDTLVAQNGLTGYDASELLNYDYTYSGEHVELGCRFPGQPMDLIVLSLSQPVRQGEGGIWCVERVRAVYSDYDWTDPHLVFPAAFGVDETAADYYARLQQECDAGEHPELLTPRGAALDYAKRVSWRFGEDISESDFETIESLG